MTLKAFSVIAAVEADEEIHKLVVPLTLKVDWHMVWREAGKNGAAAEYSSLSRRARIKGASQ